MLSFSYSFFGPEEIHNPGPTKTAFMFCKINRNVYKSLLEFEDDIEKFINYWNNDRNNKNISRCLIPNSVFSKVLSKHAWMTTFFEITDAHNCVDEPKSSVVFLVKKLIDAGIDFSILNVYL